MSQIVQCLSALGTVDFVRSLSGNYLVTRSAPSGDDCRNGAPHGGVIRSESHVRDYADTNHGDDECNDLK